MVSIVLEEYRKSADVYLTPLAKYMINANPNTLTITAFVFAVIAGIMFVISYYHTIFLVIGALFVFLNGLFDALDGKVARLSKKASKKGDFLDHVLDRYADVFIIGGLMLTPYCHPIIGLLAILGIIFASYMGTQAQAVGVDREYRGVLSRVDRLIILIVTPIIQYILLIPGKDWFVFELFKSTQFQHKFTFLEFVMLYFAIAGHITAVQRIYHAWKRLDTTKPDTKV